MVQSDLHARAASLTTHVLDMARGAPGAGMRISLLRVEGDDTELLARVVTNADGRLAAPLLTRDTVRAGTYRLEFDAASYHGVDGTFRTIPVDFTIADPAGHYHVPLVVAPGGYSTYRGAPPSHAPDDRGTWSVANAGPPALAAVPAAPAPGSVGAGLTIHALDIAQGAGAGSLAVDLCRRAADGQPWAKRGSLLVNAEGRTDRWLVGPGELHEGEYELVFHAGAYFARAGFGVGAMPFLEHVRIRIHVADVSAHHHIPLLLSPWGYTCYRGS